MLPLLLKVTSITSEIGGMRTMNITPSRLLKTSLAIPVPPDLVREKKTRSS